MRRPTLRQVFFVTILGLALFVGALVLLQNKAARDGLIEASKAVREEKTQRIADQVVAEFEQKTRSLYHLEGLLRDGAIRPADPVSIEAALFAEVAGEDEVSEATFTHAILLGRTADGVKLDPKDRWQISVYRTAGDGEGTRIETRIARLEAGRYVSEVRKRPSQGSFGSAELQRQESQDVPDPTADDTFQSPAADDDGTHILASDLHWFQHDRLRPARERRVVVSGQKAVRDAAGTFLGVLRVGLLTRRLNELVRRPSASDPHWVFFCDTQGRLLSALGPGDSVEEFGDDLRVVATSLPPEVSATLQQPALRALEKDLERPQKADFEIEGKRYLATYRHVTHSLGWVVAIVAPESAYLGALERQRMFVLGWSLVIMAIILVAGILTLRFVRRGLDAIEGSTARMRDFDFTPSEVRLPLRDLQDVGERLELAKTAMRAMGRYVPVALVRQLFKTGREPVLGGEICEASLLFTDIEGFTTISESLEPNELARLLGSYFEAMTAPIHEHHGIIDKYIGDGIMALWNVPTPYPDHARQACEAALGCIRSAEALFSSAGWAGRRRLRTRFGIHTDRVMVGHFGAPDRMSYTALGDGVNLASRLEGLNKQYGTTILLSEAARLAAGPHFEFRLLDRVAVKGKTRGVQVFELLGPAGMMVPDAVRTYERALQSYWGRDFAGAAALLEKQPEDPPSRGLLERCRHFAATPPPPDWDGIWVAMVK